LKFVGATAPEVKRRYHLNFTYIRLLTHFYLTEEFFIQKSPVPYRQFARNFKVEAVRLSESVAGNGAAKRLCIPDSNLLILVRLHRAGKFGSNASSRDLAGRGPSKHKADNARLQRMPLPAVIEHLATRLVWHQTLLG
jgi:hypothetical protein